MTAINGMFQKIFSSVDNNLYSVLDNFVFIDKDIFSDRYFQKIFGTSYQSGILLIANAFIFGFLIYYSIRLLFSYFGVTDAERPVQFVFKIVLYAILMNFSFFICEQIVYLVSLFSSAIRQVGENLFFSSICFSKLIQNLNNVITFEEDALDLFSLDGILKSFVSIGLLNLTITYAIRYILIKIFILLSPFSFLSLCTKGTSIFFKSWLKAFLSLLLIQVFVALILTFIFSLDFSSSTLFSKFILVASILVLSKANSYIRDLLGGVSTDMSLGLNALRNISFK